MNSTWIGIDVAKDSFYAAIDLDAIKKKHQLKKLPCKKFERNHKGVGIFLSWAKSIMLTNQISIVMESTGAYSIELMFWLKEFDSDIAVSIQNGRQISDFTKSLNLPHKTDKNDACAIARFGTERTPATSKMRPTHWRKLRELQRERTAIIEARVALENRLDSLFHKESITINKRAICALNKQIEALDKAIKQCVLENEDILQEVHIMTTMPGVAWVSACTILAEIGLLKQYNSRELSSLSGLAPRWFKSGSSIDRSYMGRRGSKRLRQVLYLCSIPATKKSQKLAELHNRITAKGKMKMTARCACMRKLLIILRAMVVNNQVFCENYEKDKKTA